MSKPADFWSRRKAAVAEEQVADIKERAETEAAVERARLEEKTDAEILDELGLKDPDEMQAGDDFAAFLKAAVPDRLRRRALRRLWLSNPVLANLDSLVDYGEDYSDAATVVENLQTAIQLGRGALSRAEAQIEAISGEEDAPTSVRPPETDRFPTETAGAETHDTMASTGVTHPDGVEGVSVVEAGSEPDPRSDAGTDPLDEAPRPRRMKFHFSD